MLQCIRILLILSLLNINQHHPPVSIQQNIPNLTELPMVKPSNIPGNGSKAAIDWAKTPINLFQKDYVDLVPE